MDRHLVSVIMPVYNCEAYLAEAIDSVLAQTHRPLELVVIDDGSTDHSAEIAKRYPWPVRYCFQCHSGVSAALNRGTEVAQGRYFAFLDADDLWIEEKLARQMAAFESQAGLDVVFGYVEQFRSPELVGGPAPTEIMPGIFKGAMLIKRESFLRVGRFDTSWQIGDFVDWYLRASEVGLKSCMLPEVVMKRRIHTNNMGTRERRYQTEFARILKASLDRRRRLNGQVG